MTQVANTYIRNKNDIATYGLGSVLSGGSGGPKCAGEPPHSGRTWFDDY
jgi:beta-glucosidase